MERTHHEARQKGNLNPGGGEGTWGTTGGREQVWGPGLGSLLTMLPWFPRHPNLEDAQMRPRHAARVQRPYGQNPNAIRRDSEDTLAHINGHTAESPRTRSRIDSSTLSGPSLTDGPPRPGDNPTRQLCDHGALVPLPDRSTVLITLVSVNIAD